MSAIAEWTYRIAKDLIQEISYSTTSADKAYGMLRDRGYSFTRAEVRQAWHDYNVETGWAGPISQWPRNRTIPKSWITTRDTETAAGFMHVLKYTVVNDETGEKTVRTWAIVLESPEKFSNIIAMAAHDMEIYGSALGGRVQDIRPNAVVRFNPRRG